MIEKLLVSQLRKAMGKQDRPIPEGAQSVQSTPRFARLGRQTKAPELNLPQAPALPPPPAEEMMLPPPIMGPGGAAAPMPPAPVADSATLPPDEFDMFAQNSGGF